MADYKYKAIQDGTLSEPYRFVPQGTVVVLPEKLEKPSSWLVPVNQAKSLPVIPPVPYVGADGGSANKAFGPLDALKPELHADPDTGFAVPQTQDHATGTQDEGGEQIQDGTGEDPLS